MTTTSGLSVRRLSAEFGVIVVGVLVALAVDSCAQERSDATREGLYLHQLVADLEQTLGEADAALASEARWLEMVRKLESGFNEEVLPPDDSLAYWTENTLRSTRFRPVVATVDALIGAGDLALVSSDVIRRGIVDYREAVRNLHEGYATYDEASLDALASLNRRVNRDAIEHGTSPRRYPVVWEDIASDRVFRGDLTTHSIAVSSRRALIESLLTVVEPLLGIVREELDS